MHAINAGQARYFKGCMKNADTNFHFAMVESILQWTWPKPSLFLLLLPKDTVRSRSQPPTNVLWAWVTFLTPCG